jgi:heptosyltransferase-3
MLRGMNAPHQPTLIIFRIGSIGDTVVALPCLHAIARQFAAHRRILLTEQPIAARASSAQTVLTGSGLIDGALHYPAGLTGFATAPELIRRIRATGARTLVYLAPRTQIRQVWRDRLFFRLAGIRTVYGMPVTSGGLRRRHSDGVMEHESEYLARSLAPEIPVDLSRSNWDLCLTGAEQGAAATALSVLPAGMPIVALAPGAKLATKDWGEANWTALVAAAAAWSARGGPGKAGVALVTLGAADERELAARILGAWSGARVNLCGRLTTRESAAVLGRCGLLVCHDSGPMHLATTRGTPCLALFGNHNTPRQWFPYGEQHQVIHDTRGITAITVGTVADALTTAMCNLLSASERQTGARVRHLTVVGRR